MNKCYLGFTFILVAATACAGHHEKTEVVATDEQAMMPAAMPGDAHHKLAQSVGNYSADMLFWSSPDSEAMRSTMTVERSMDLGGRVLVERWKGDVMGAPFEGASRTGYDNVAKRYWSTWTDNMSTGLLVMYGDWNDDKQAMELVGTSVHPMTGKEYTMRSVGTYPSADRETVVMYEDHGQGEYKSMSFTINRQHFASE